MEPEAMGKIPRAHRSSQGAGSRIGLELENAKLRRELETVSRQRDILSLMLSTVGIGNLFARKLLGRSYGKKETLCGTEVEEAAQGKLSGSPVEGGEWGSLVTRPSPGFKSSDLRAEWDFHDRTNFKTQWLIAAPSAIVTTQLISKRVDMPDRPLNL
jgi:hypothetical protein